MVYTSVSPLTFTFLSRCSLLLILAALVALYTVLPAYEIKSQHALAGYLLHLQAF